MGLRNLGVAALADIEARSRAMSQTNGKQYSDGTDDIAGKDWKVVIADEHA